jgi:hypothetical protein
MDFLNLNLLGQVWQPAANYNGCLASFKLKEKAANCHYYLQRAVTPEHSLQSAGRP